MQKSYHSRLTWDIIFGRTDKKHICNAIEKSKRPKGDVLPGHIGWISRGQICHFKFRFSPFSLVRYRDKSLSPSKTGKTEKTEKSVLPEASDRWITVVLEGME